MWGRIRGILSFNGGCRSSSCHGKPSVKAGHSKKIALVGSPNVGKSVVFNKLTGASVTVSNYPGTTVEVSRGKAKLNGQEFEFIDTPGLYSLLPITEEERVARLILLEEKPDAVLHMVDAKNLERMLFLSLQFIEAGFPIILVLNMMDEVEDSKIEIDIQLLERKLKIPVVATIATSGQGLRTLCSRVEKYVRG